MLRRPFSRFLRWFATLTGSYLALAAILTTTVDPWRINAAPWALARLDNSREISQITRVGKAAIANRGIWQAAIFGSSRLESGLDPTHPALPPSRSVNLALSGAWLMENLAVANYTLDRNPQLKTIIFGIDPGDLHSAGDSRSTNHFYQSPFADNNRSLERSINQLIGWRAFTDSLATLKRHFKGRVPKCTPLGQMLHPVDHGNLRAYIESAFIENSANQWALCPQLLRQHKAAALTEFIGRARRAGVQLFIIIPPQHALKQIHPTADRPQTMGWETDLRALIDICTSANAIAAPGPPAQLWSFLTFNPHTTTPMPLPGAACQAMPGWFDLGHADNNLGNQVLDTLLAARHGASAVTSPVGVNLLDGEWNAIRATWIEGHENFCASHPQDVAWWRSLVARAAAKADAKTDAVAQNLR